MRCPAPASSITFHACGDQATEAAVRGRAPMLFDPEAKVTALSEASPWTMRLVAVLLVSSVWNWIQAAWINAPGGIGRLVKRTPTVCTLAPSVTSSRSLLVSATDPLETRCSASSLPVATRRSTV